MAWGGAPNIFYLTPYLLLGQIRINFLPLLLILPCCISWSRWISKELFWENYSAKIKVVSLPDHWSDCDHWLTVITDWQILMRFPLKGSYHKKILPPKPHILDSNGVWTDRNELYQVKLVSESEGPKKHLDLKKMLSKFVPWDLKATRTWDLEATRNDPCGLPRGPIAGCLEVRAGCLVVSLQALPHPIIIPNMRLFCSGFP